MLVKGATGVLSPGHQWLQCWVYTHTFLVVYRSKIMNIPAAHVKPLCAAHLHSKAFESLTHSQWQAFACCTCCARRLRKSLHKRSTSNINEIFMHAIENKWCLDITGNQAHDYVKRDQPDLIITSHGIIRQAYSSIVAVVDRWGGILYIMWE